MYCSHRGKQDSETLDLFVPQLLTVANLLSVDKLPSIGLDYVVVAGLASF